jgi:hypothetical protein
MDNCLLFIGYVMEAILNYKKRRRIRKKGRKTKKGKRMKADGRETVVQ